MVKYTIEKHKQMNCYILWKNVKRDHSYGCRGIFQGTRKECKEKLKEIESEGI